MFIRARRFECVEGSSRKFWEVVVEGPQVKVTFGRIGTAGQTDVKSFDDAAAANKHAEHKVREKLRKAYVQVA